MARCKLKVELLLLVIHGWTTRDRRIHDIAIHHVPVQGGRVGMSDVLLLLLCKISHQKIKIKRKSKCGCLDTSKEKSKKNNVKVQEREARRKKRYGGEVLIGEKSMVCECVNVQMYVAFYIDLKVSCLPEVGHGLFFHRLCHR